MPRWETLYSVGVTLVSLFPHYCLLQRLRSPRHVPKGVIGLEARSLIIGPTAEGYTGIDEY